MARYKYVDTWRIKPIENPGVASKILQKITKMPRGSAGGGKRGGVSFSRPQDPAFLRRMKEQVGYKNPDEDLNAKVM